ncbi:MAG: EAL domain-containing protein [Treponema sp.]|nr:EAL domain-containing protein [Treponema sp.]
MTSLEIIYYSLAAVTCVVLSFTLINVRRSKAPDKRLFSFPIVMALITVPIYSGLVASKTYFWAMLFNGLYFACTDWLGFSMLLFVLAYTWRSREIKPTIIVLTPLVLTDTISLIVNAWTAHSCNLTKVALEDGFEYWTCSFTPLHFVHLGFCYVMVLATLVCLLQAIITAPYGYKTKYVSIFLAFIVVILANAFCYSQDFLIDFSVFIYPLLALFIHYNSSVSAARKLLTNSLTNVNENIEDAILYFDINDDCFYTNSKAKLLFRDDDGKFSPLKASEFLIYARGKTQGTKSSKPIELFTLNGQERQFEIETEDIFYGYNLIGSYLKLSDKTDEINKYLTQKFLANHDELTGAYNREYFFKACDEKIKQNPDTEYLMLSSNIRQFKLVNELFGEEVGNKILTKMVTSTKMLAIHDCVLGRVGDDRFGLLVQKQYFTEASIKAFLEMSQQVLEDSMYKLNLCVGVCEVHGDSESAQLLYDKTQLAIKNIGNDYQKHIAYYNSDLMDELLRERQITAEFEEALATGQICMYLQPLVNSEEKLIGSEALARWNHPQRGLLEPEFFLPALERSGLIHKLDTFMWEQVAILLESWSKRGIDNMRVSVNVSAKDNFYIDIADSFKQLLLRHTFNPQNVKVELPESALTNGVRQVVELFTDLKQLGFEVGIDNFGRGYSSLNFLKDVNADILKIDMALVQENQNPERIKTILKFIVDIAKALNLRLVSEGVETMEQLRTLKELGFSYFQGHYFSKPLPISDFEEKYL